MSKPYLTTQNVGNPRRYDPQGIYGVKISWEKPGDLAFYRPKISGSLTFSGPDHTALLTTGPDCCQRLSFTLRREGGESVVPFQLNTGSLDVNVGLCQSTANTFEFIDGYSDLFRLWEKPVNVLAMPASDIRVLHNYCKRVETYQGERVTYELIGNQRFRWLADLVLYVVGQTCTGNAAKLVPPTSGQLSTALTEILSSVTGKTNLLRRLGVCQASDALDPISSQSATGLLENGKLNESMAMTLKKLLSDLKALFDLDWHIDAITGYLRIEHRAFYENGYSYQSPRTGIDLRLDAYAEARAHWWGNYKNDFASLPGIQELKLSLNESVLASKLAFPPGYVFKDSDPGFVAVDDFVSATTRYDSPCLTQDEKGETSRATQSADLFCTYWGAVMVGDDSIDATKWMLCELVPFALFGAQGNGYVVALGAAERRNATDIPNGNLTATTLNRLFHRHRAPFDSGIQNEREGFPGTSGYQRRMYSTQRVKRYEPISLPFCGGVADFDPTALVVLPDGTLAEVLKAELNLADNRLTLTLTGQAACFGEVTFPPVTVDSDGNPLGGTSIAAGTLLRKEERALTCYQADPYDLYSSPQTYEIMYIRSYFADGYGGEYYTDDRSSC